MTCHSAMQKELRKLQMKCGKNGLYKQNQRSTALSHRLASCILIQKCLLCDGKWGRGTPVNGSDEDKAATMGVAVQAP